jgi:hypothetical protein
VSELTSKELTHQVMFRCDGCGCTAPGSCTRSGSWVKPHAWFQRTDSDGTQLVCSRECIDKVAAASGKTSVVLPV